MIIPGKKRKKEDYGTARDEGEPLSGNTESESKRESESES